jgi:molybdopterin synthase catalytic subunit
MDNLEIYDGHIDSSIVFDNWYKKYRFENYGAFITFVGIIRDENSIDGLSFDIYMPILESWFDSWQQRANTKNAKIIMAHSKGDVFLHETSFICAILSPKRRVALELIDEFVEDFKANAPIWKYDLINNQRVYAEDRSTAIDGSGLLSRN